MAIQDSPQSIYSFRTCFNFIASLPKDYCCWYLVQKFTQHCMELEFIYSANNWNVSNENISFIIFTLFSTGRTVKERKFFPLRLS